MVWETCKALWEQLCNTFMKVPDTNGWHENWNDFWKYWNFPNCCGTINEKHIWIQAPSNSGSEFFNYKGYFSIILLAVYNASYLLSVINIGSARYESDTGIFARSKKYEILDTNKIRLPKNMKPLNYETLLPYFAVGDEAFPLKQYLLYPYPGKNLTFEQKMFNYRLSRAWRIIENTFGIISELLWPSGWAVTLTQEVTGF